MERRPEGGPRVDERGVLSLLRRWRWTIAAAVVLGAVASYAFASRLSPTYQASAHLLVGTLSTEPQAIGSRMLTPTYSTLATTRRILSAAIEESGVEMTPSELAGHVRTEGSRSTRIVTIRVRNEDPEQAARLANAIASALEAATTPRALPATPLLREFVWRGRKYEVGELAKFVRDIGGDDQYRQWAAIHPEAAAVLTRTKEQVRADRRARRDREVALARAAVVVEPAAPPVNPIRPDVGLAVQYGALAAVLAVLGFALLSQQMGSRIRTGADLEHAANVPFLGPVDEPAGTHDRERTLHAGSSYHRLVGSLRLGGAPPATRSLVVVGAETNADAIVGSLGDAAADYGARVAVIAAGPDGRSERDQIHAPDASSGEAQRLLERLLGDADVVLVSAPPIDRSPAALVWAPLADATLVVARRDRTRMRTVARTIRALGDVHARVVGTILRGHGA